MTKASVKKQKTAFLKLLKENKIKKKIIDVFEAIDQGIFFDSIFEDKFYSDEKILIGCSETSDNFLMLAHMINYLNPTSKQRILEVGTGSGYSTAILSMLCREVVTVEYNEKLAVSAKNKLYSYEFENIRFFAGDATETEQSFGKIDGVIVHSACKKRPLKLMAELAEGGKMIFPMGPETLQQIISLENSRDENYERTFKTQYYQQGEFPLIYGLYGYETPDFSEMGDEAYLEPTIAKSNGENSNENSEKETKVKPAKKNVKTKIKRKLFGKNK